MFKNQCLKLYSQRRGGSRSRRVRFKLTSLDAGPHESSVRNPRLGLVFAILLLIPRSFFYPYRYRLSVVFIICALQRSQLLLFLELLCQFAVCTLNCGSPAGELRELSSDRLKRVERVSRLTGLRPAVESVSLARPQNTADFLAASRYTGLGKAVCVSNALSFSWATLWSNRGEKSPTDTCIGNFIFLAWGVR